MSKIIITGLVVILLGVSVSVYSQYFKKAAPGIQASPTSSSPITTIPSTTRSNPPVTVQQKILNGNIYGRVIGKTDGGVLYKFGVYSDKLHALYSTAGPDSVIIIADPNNKIKSTSEALLLNISYSQADEIYNVVSAEVQQRGIVD